MARRRERGWAASVHAACGAPGGHADLCGFRSRKQGVSFRSRRRHQVWEGNEGTPSLVRSNPFTPLPPTPLYTTQPAHKSSLVERRKPRTLRPRRGHGPTALPRAQNRRFHQLPSYHPSLGAGLREEHMVDEVRLLEAALGREPSLHEQRLGRGEN